MSDDSIQPGSQMVSLADEEGVKQVLVSAVFDLWEVVNNLTRLRPSKRERYRVTIFGSARAKPQTLVYEEVKRLAQALAENVLQPAEFESFRRRLSLLPDPPAHPRLHRDDWLGGVAVFLWVLVSTFPVVIPFILVGNAMFALRISNSVAVVMLFLTGHAFGRCAGYRPWALGFSMVLLGGALVGITIALGG